MTYFEVMQTLGIDNAVDFIERISLKIIDRYAPGTEISNFDKEDIQQFIKKCLEKEAEEKRCTELGIFQED